MPFRIGELHVEIASDDPNIQVALESLCNALFHSSGNKVASFKTAIPLLVLPSNRLDQRYSVFQGDGFSLGRTKDSHYLFSNTSAWIFNIQQREIQSYFSPCYWQQPLGKQRLFLLRGGILLMQEQGAFGLHANAVTCENDSVLIVGRSGSGKSTLTLGLLHAHWSCLGDDALLLRKIDHHIEAQALRRGFGCTAQTAIQFPKLAPLLRIAPALSDNKKLLDLENLWPDCFTPRCTPKIIVFPEVADAPHSRLSALTPSQTLCALMEQSVGLLTDRTIAQHYMRILNQLTHQASGYRLHTGRDIYTEPDRVANLLRLICQRG